MNDPLHDEVPHLVPHSPDWPVGRIEAIVAAVIAVAVLIALMKVFH